MIDLELYDRRVREGRNARDARVPLKPPSAKPPGGSASSLHVSAGPASPRSPVSEVMAGLAVLGGLAGFYAAGAAGITVVAGVTLGGIAGALVVPVLKLITRISDVGDPRAASRRRGSS